MGKLKNNINMDCNDMYTSLPYQFFKVYLLFESRHLWDTDELFVKKL